MTPSEFADKWRKVELSERSASQAHFLDLCVLVEHPTPADIDPTGDTFTFEKGAAKSGGGDGWADVWKKGFFAWEYKGKRKNLAAAYEQLLRYREDLENPPLLIVCDMDRFQVRTNFTATPTVVHEFGLDDLAEPVNMDKLRAIFHDPESLRPGVTSERITSEAAGHLAELAKKLRDRGHDPHAVARFLDRIVFCLFAEDIELLPDHLFSHLIQKTRTKPARFSKYLADLFATMAGGGDFLLQDIRHFNGNLFTDATVLELTVDELGILTEVSRLDWSAIDPSIFGTLFERGMDPDKRAQLGAHYTSRQDIETLVEPVVMQPLRREWQEIRNTIACLLATGRKPQPGETPAAWAGLAAPAGMKLKKARGEAEPMVQQFLHRLAGVTVLDPACGSGNFLYVTLQKLKDLEKEVILFAMDTGLGSFLPGVGPWQLHGIELNPYAFDLAQMTVWIGYLQWTRTNGFGISQDPVLRPMAANFQCRDAILDRSDPGNLREPEWPRVDAIVGNPPFLGDKLMRRELGDAYVEALRTLYAGRIPGQSDLCCYWFEKTRAHIAAGRCRRAGLLATQSIRGGASRQVLDRVKQTGDIFWAVSDQDWILDGANVHVSMVGFDDAEEKHRILDAKPVAKINSNLTASADVTLAHRLRECHGLAFIGNCKGGAFDLDDPAALVILHTSGNPHRRPNSDVLRPVLNSEDLFSRGPQRWIIDNADLELAQACLYEKPHEVVLAQVKPHRDGNRDSWLRENWWRPQRMRTEMREATRFLERFLVTPTTSKHRIYCWLSHPTLPDHKLVVFARSDDLFLGMLHSRIHEVWARAQGTQLRERESGLNYNIRSSFETFPFPWPPGNEPKDDPRVQEIAAAARELNELRENWLNPPEWTRTEVLEFPGTVGGPWDHYIINPRLPGADNLELADAEDATAIEYALAERAVELARRDATVRRPVRPGEVSTVHYPRIVPRDADCAKRLAARTLTNLYNQRPTWLEMAHRRLDSAVFAAYGWDPAMSDESILASLLELNRERSSGETSC